MKNQDGQIDPIKDTIERAENISFLDIAHVLAMINQRAEYCNAIRLGNCSVDIGIEYVRSLNDQIKKYLAL